jgi:hypothetical protein
VTVKTMTLTDFLRARFAEDEAEAEFVHDDQCTLVLYPDRAGCSCDRTRRRRMLAECDAKRRIAERHSPVPGEFHMTTHPESPDDDAIPADGLACRTCGAPDEYGIPWPCGTLRDLALPYADHPDYDPEWKP